MTTTVRGLPVGARATVQVDGVGAHVFLSAPRGCDTGLLDNSLTCSVTGTGGDLTLAFTAIHVLGQPRLTFTVSSADVDDSDPSNNTFSLHLPSGSGD